MPEFVTLSEYARFENRVLTSIREVREDVADTKTLVLNVQSGLQAHIDTVALELNTKIDSVRNELMGEINSLRGELKGEITTLRGELKGEITTLRSEMHDLRSEVRANAHYANTALAAICAHMGIELPHQ